MKTLIDKLRKVGKGVKKGLWVATAVASLGVASCKLCPDPEPINYAPVASLYVNPQSVEVNSPVNLELTGTDEDGNDDIIEYKVYVDKGADGTIEETITSPNPINQSWSSDYVGNVKIQGKVTDSQGAVGKATPITINVYSFPTQDYVDISGRLEDCENDGIGRKGIIKVYDASTNPPTLIGDEHFVNGTFNLTLEKKVSELPNGVIIQARIENAAPESYVGTIKANIDSLSEPDVALSQPIIVVPYDNPNDSYDDGLIDGLITKEQFKNHIMDINKSAELWGFDLTKLKGIKILKYNRNGSSVGSFFNPENIKQRMMNSKITHWFNKNSMIMEINTDPNPNINFYINDNWVILEPYNGLGPNVYGITSHFPEGSMFANAALIKLLSNPNSSSGHPYDYVIGHETGHSSNVAAYEADLPGHLTYTPNHLTVLETGISIPPNELNPILIGKADSKASRTVHKYFGKSLDDVMRLNWGFSSP